MRDYGLLRRQVSSNPKPNRTDRLIIRLTGVHLIADCHAYPSQPEGVAFKSRAEEAGFKQAVAERDSGDPIPGSKK